MFFIDWIPQSAVALYIYRVGGLAPQEILLQDLNLWKSLVVLGLCLDRSNLPVKPVGSCRIGYIVKDRSDRLERPVRPAGLVCCQFWSSTGCFSLTCWMNSIKLSICHASVAGKNDHQWSSVYCVRYVLVPCRYLVAKYLPMLIYNASVKLKFCLKEP